jgi:hypothetical protein
MLAHAAFERTESHRRSTPIVVVRPLSVNEADIDALVPGTPLPGATQLPLGEHHYVQTEESWKDAGQPTARVQLGVTNWSLIVDIDANVGAAVVPPPGAQNVLDNERAEINGHGVQLYFGATPHKPWAMSWLAVPAPDTAPHARVVRLTPGSPEVDTQFANTPNGWAMRFIIPLPSLPIQRDAALQFELIVNERPADRERRRGQLVISGGGGFGYLRGDRANPEHAIRLQLPSAAAL